MKKLFCILASLLCLLALCACGDQNTPPPPDAPVENLEEKIEAYHLSYSDEDIQAAIDAATQYYANVASQEIDPSLYMEHELAEMMERDDWLSQGVEVDYDMEWACAYIDSCAMGDYMQQCAPGTEIFLHVIVPAAPEDSVWHERVVEMARADTQSPWGVRTEGL